MGKEWPKLVTSLAALALNTLLWLVFCIYTWKQKIPLGRAHLYLFFWLLGFIPEPFIEQKIMGFLEEMRDYYTLYEESVDTDIKQGYLTKYTEARNNYFD